MVNDYISEDAAKVIVGSNGFLLLKTDKNLLSFNGLVEVAQYRIGAELYSLVRKVISEDIIV